MCTACILRWSLHSGIFSSVSVAVITGGSEMHGSNWEIRPTGVRIPHGGFCFLFFFLPKNLREGFEPPLGGISITPIACQNRQ